jgi:protein arginine kinase
MLWYETKNIGCTISTRVRLARNLEGVPFPSRLPLAKLKEVNKQIADAIEECDFGVKLRKVDMETVGEYEIYSMVERHIISPKFANRKEGRILFVSDDEHLSIMIGEEDHLRIQVLNTGLCLKETYDFCDEIDTLLSQKLKFAFDERLGFLTECPTNLGTGMRASVMLHLPVLNSTGELKNIAENVGKIGLTFRGFYGEGSNSKANVYQLSNQVTLGISETDALENLKKSDNFTILLSHRPEYFDIYVKHGFDLVLSGHAHGGQFRLPFAGGVIAPGQGFFPDYDSGLYEKENTKMIVSRGLGNSIIPLRLFNRPEIISITVKST